MRPMTVHTTALQKSLQEVDTPIVKQTKRCNPKGTDPCKPCITKKHESCRFWHLRAFKKDNETDKTPRFIDYKDKDILNLHFRKGRIQHHPYARNYVLKGIRQALYATLKEDVQERQRHGHKIRRRAPMENVRHVCDICLTTIFNTHYMCSVCALDLCINCYDKDWSIRENKALSRCSYRRVHEKGHMVPMVKYEDTTLKKIESECVMDVDDLLPSQAEKFHTTPAQRNTAPADSGCDYLAVDAKHLTLEKFQESWKTGRPILVRNAMSKSSRQHWSPGTFRRQHGKEMTEVIDCKTGTREEIKVEKFFRGFENIRMRPGYNRETGIAPIYKIKDWPPKDDFENCFPEQYRDFMENLPIKEYCSPSGYYNLSNRVPKNQVPPDLGPKMFIAYGSDVGEEGVGTTKLHNDMADAVNIMCYTYATDEKPAAVWDIFPYECLDTIREFVTKIAKERKIKIRDPIHDQWLYLNNDLRERLEKEHGVKSWRILQNVGDAVFIPAGCTHQVSNYHSAVKCAYDFVSPENVDRCIDLTKQFAHVRREDALQIHNTILFTWHDTML